MSPNSFGDRLRITTFGESHGPAVGVVIDGVRPGMELGTATVQAELDRRRPGRDPASSARSEADRAEILSGVFEGRTTGAPICILVRNLDARSGDYERFKDLLRPGHGDLTWLAKYGVRDWRGGGRLSGRETVGRVAASAIARQLLDEAGVSIFGHVVEAAGIRAKNFQREVIETNPMRCADPDAAVEMLDAVQQARQQSDSVGAVLEIVAEGVPAGWGDPVFGKLDASLAQAMMSIGAVKGVEIGAGFAAARMRGSEHNDPILPGGFESNHAGGVLGGISSGGPVRVRLAVKPTSSIGQPQQTVDTAGQPRQIEVRGRHDPCIGPRAVPVAEAMMALVLADAYLEQQALRDAPADLTSLRAAIDRTDAELLFALGKRFAIAHELARLKRASDAAPLDRDREQDLDTRWRAIAEQLSLDPDLAADLLERILRTSRDVLLRR